MHRAGAGLEADSLLIIFTLAALPQEDQHHMLSNAFKVLLGLCVFTLPSCVSQAAGAEPMWSAVLTAGLARLARSFSGIP